jgi:hypothetical protein
VRIPSFLRTISKNHAIRGWVDGKKCPREDYFRSVDGARELFQRHAGDDGATDPDYDAIAPVIARLLDHEGALYEHVRKQDHCPQTEDGWAAVCLAAAWVTLERYEQALESGEWPPTT